MKTIYILENNTYLKQQISITLEKAGYETVFFSSADFGSAHGELVRDRRRTLL